MHDQLHKCIFMCWCKSILNFNAAAPLKSVSYIYTCIQNRRENTLIGGGYIVLYSLVSQSQEHVCDCYLEHIHSRFTQGN